MRLTIKNMISAQTKDRLLWCLAVQAQGPVGSGTVAARRARDSALGAEPVQTRTRTTTILGHRLRAVILALAVTASGLALGLPASALAAEPFVSTGGFGSTGPTTALAEGEVFPNGESTKYHFAYGLASSEWCTTSAAKGAPEHTTVPATLPSTEGSQHVTAELTALSSGKGYCGQLLAENGSGLGHGELLSFIAGVPALGNVGRPEATGATTALYTAEVDPGGQSTSDHVAYGLASTEWCTSFGREGSPESSTTPAALGFTDATFHFVTVELVGLSPGKEYCAEFLAENASGGGHGGQNRFTAGTPSALTQTPPITFSTGPTTETFAGQVDPAGQTTTYHVAYGLASSQWCTSIGTESSPEHTTAAVALGALDARYHSVEVPVTGLTAGKEYCAAVIAENGSGASSPASSEIRFTAGAPVVRQGGEPFATGATTAKVEGSVDPGGLATHYRAEYGLESSEWCAFGGTAGSPEHLTTPELLGFTDGVFHEVSVEATGLIAGKAYCVGLFAENEDGKSESRGLFRVLAGLPTAFLDFESSPQSTGPTTVNIEGEINPAGQTTHYQVEYGLATSPWCLTSEGAPEHTTSLETLGFTDGSFHKITAGVSGLVDGKEYCVVLAVSNGTGAAVGSEVRPLFTTFIAGAPAVGVNFEVSAGDTTASIEGEVDPAGQTTHYQAEYGLASSKWCTSGGFEGSPEHTTAAEPLAFTDGSFHRVAVEITGLSSTTEYCAALAAENGTTIAHSSTVSFTTKSAPSGGGTNPTPINGSTASTATAGTAATTTTRNAPSTPIVGQRQTVSIVSGAVTVRPRGSSRFVALSGSTSIPDGSEVEATDGRVLITVATPSGKTVTAEVYGGRFRVHQDSSGETHFVLTLPLAGCPRVTLPHGAAARLAKHSSGAKSRHLWVSEGGGSWGTGGRYVSTTVEGTTWLTVDECTRSEVKVTAGKVKVLDLVLKKTHTLSAGRRYVATLKPKGHRR